MRRAIFASIEFVYDFDTEAEARNFIKNNRNKGWYFDGEPELTRDGAYTLVVRKPYRDYNPGW